MEFFVFVYGSLKEGFGNHDVLRGAKFIAATKTKEQQFRMVSLEAFPAVLKDGNCSIVGEVYKVDLYTMVFLDMLESNGDLYNREKVQLDSGHTAWMYLFMYDMETPPNNVRVMTENRTQTWMLPTNGLPEEFKRTSTK